MLQQKEKHILQYLLDNKESFVTSMELATHLSCSDRTVRTYLKSLMGLSPQMTGWSIISKQGYGYRLEIKDEEQYQEFIKAELLLEADAGSVADIEDRYNYILNKLLFEREALYFDNLTEELFVSRSTLSSDFKKIRTDLAKYDVQVESKPKRGVYVTGSERNIRRFIMDHFFRDRFFQALHNYINIEISGRPISLEELTIIVLDECREGDLRLSDFVIQNLVIHIALSFKRVAEGFQINQLEGWSSKDYPDERKIAEKILRRVYQATGLVFPREEVDYITLHLISKAHCQVGKQKKVAIHEKIRQELLAVLEQESLVKGYPFQQDFQLVEGVVTHLATLFVRMKNHVVLENPLLADIRQHYSDIFDMTKSLLAAMPLWSEQVLSDDEVAYVALHFMAAIERLKEKQKFNILVICATGYGSAQMLKNRIDNELGNLVHIVDVIGYYDLNDESLKDIDFIISSIDLSNLVFSIPVFTVSIFLNADEIKDIKQKIAQLKPTHALAEKKPANEEVHLEKVFDNYFSQESFLLLDSSTKEASIERLLETMAPGEEADFVPQMQDLICQREKMSSVVFSDRVAVPHPIKPFAKQGRIGLAIIREGINWSSDYPAIGLVFLPSPSIYGNEGLELLTKQIVHLLDQKDLQEQLLACKSFTAFKEVFLKIK